MDLIVGVVRRFWWVLLIAIIAVGGFIFRDFIGGAVTDLRVGDCFEMPADTAEIDDVQHKPCNEPHDAEVIAVLTHPAERTAAWPGSSGFDDFIRENCVPAFQSYTGRAFATADELDLGWFYPTQGGWQDGDRGITCHILRVDGGKMTGSLRASGSSPLRRLPQALKLLACAGPPTV